VILAFIVIASAAGKSLANQRKAKNGKAAIKQKISKFSHAHLAIICL